MDAEGSGSPDAEVARRPVLFAHDLRFGTVVRNSLQDAREAVDGRLAGFPAEFASMSESIDRRRHPRFTVDPMYSAVSVVRRGQREEGHVYDVSLSGMRFELDRPARRGSTLDVEVSLPGCEDAIRAKARVVRVFDEVDDPGPRRMAVEFETFSAGSRAILERYLGQKWLRPAPAQEPESAPQKPVTIARTTRSSAAACESSPTRSQASRPTTKSASAA